MKTKITQIKLQKPKHRIIGECLLETEMDNDGAFVCGKIYSCTKYGNYNAFYESIGSNETFEKFIEIQSLQCPNAFMRKLVDNLPISKKMDTRETLRLTDELIEKRARKENMSYGHVKFVMEQLHNIVPMETDGYLDFLRSFYENFLPESNVDECFQYDFPFETINYKKDVLPLIGKALQDGKFITFYEKGSESIGK